MSGRGDSIGKRDKQPPDVKAVGRDDPPAERLEHLNGVLRVDQTAHPITSVIVDGYEESSSIVLVRDAARNIVFPGAAAMLNQNRLPAIVGAVIRRGLPSYTKDQAAHIADLIWSLSTMRNIYDSVESAVSYGRSYIHSAQITNAILGANGKIDASQAWPVFSDLDSDETAADNAGVTPRATIVPWSNGERLVIRTWFHRHVVRDLGRDSLTEQRIASLMGMAGWTSLPRARSAITVHNPADHADTAQFRFYVVPEHWEMPLDEDPETP